MLTLLFSISVCELVNVCNILSASGSAKVQGNRYKLLYKSRPFAIFLVLQVVIGPMVTSLHPETPVS